MLVLTRKQSETIQIGDSITITVLRMKGKSVRLGIRAPHDLNVIRGELAFDQPAEDKAAGDVAEAATAEQQSEAPLRSRGPRQDSSWSSNSESSAIMKVGCAAAWST